MRAHPSRLVRASSILLVTLYGFLARNVNAEAPIVTSQIILPAGGGQIHAEVFAQSGLPRGPAVIVLHGAGGTLLDGPEMRRIARYLASDGNKVYLVHYFDRTGTLFARDATMQKNFEAWLATVRDAIVAVQRRGGDASPIGLYGYSLGGFLALAAASDNPQVGAVVEQAGGVWNGRMERIGKMPPVLMIHGEADGRVPFEKYAKPLIPVLRSRAVSLQTDFFSGEGHGFTRAAMARVRAEAAMFFRKHLPREQSAAKKG